MLPASVTKMLEDERLKRVTGRILSLKKTSCRLKATSESEEKIDVGSTKFGGYPDAPPDFKIPMWDGKPMVFIAQLNLSDLIEFDNESKLPSNGILYFFFNDELEIGYKSPSEKSWQVFYYGGDMSTLQRLSKPDISLYHPCIISFSQEITLPPCPPWETSHFDDFPFTKEEVGLYANILDELTSWYEKEDICIHRVLGHPQVIQNDMQRECQLARNGLYWWDDSYYEENSNRNKLQEGASSWQLLFQIDSEENTGFSWHDGGRLYFWIHEDNLRQHKFDNVWCCLQST